MIDSEVSSFANSFWKWFKNNVSRLDPYNFDHSLIGELEGHLGIFGGFDWEVGIFPGSEEVRYFALSPSGDSGRLGLARAIVSVAPFIEGWEFFPAKPPKPEALVVTVQGSNGKDVEVDASAWEFVVYRNPDGSCDIVVKPDVRAAVDLGYVATIVVDNLLGEELRLTSVRAVEITFDWNDGEALAAQPLRSESIARAITGGSAH